ncbi:hypothetical protein [Moraxella porci]|uniref:hypothetical protein n=1 Tax=Moraxella porci TaxID=1288392 RepID=UPI002447927B|nr:hypothetical protein [Moraxella porci]MDH2272953.1 hypothetical protein [Moraxella porci]
MSDWISVKDELPPGNEFVLVYVYGQIKVYFYAVSDDVTPWMPLPQPPTRKMAVLTVPHDNS